MTRRPTSAQRLTTRRMLVASAIAVAVGTSLQLSGCDRMSSAGKKASFKSVDITGADYAKGFSLKDPQGKTRTLQEFAGKVVLVFFGFTQCPDICPTTLSQMAQVMQLLGPQSDKVQVIFVSVDPERDTPQVMEAYTKAFDPRFLGLTSDIPTINATAKDFKAFYQKVPGKTPTSYTVDHTAASYVFDQQGRIRLYVRHGTTPADLASDLKQLLA